MRLVGKLTLALVLGWFAVVLLQTSLRIDRETRRFEAELREHHQVIGRVVGAALAKAWQSGGEEKARALLEAARLTSRAVQLRWVSLATSAQPESVDPALADRLRRGETVTVTDWRRPPAGWLYTYSPVEVDGRELGALEMAEPLDDERRYLSATIWRAVFFASLTLALGSAITVLVGEWVVGRPMRMLVDKARRIGAGELGAPLELSQRDEIGVLAREMNAMCERLSRTQGELTREISARQATVEQLRHADRLMSVGVLASAVAHELGTQLSLIAGRNKMILTGEVSGGEVQECARIVADQTERITQIIRQLLDLARRRTPRRAPDELRHMVLGAFDLVRPLARQSQVELLLVGLDASYLVETDAGQMQQALTNLLINGIHAMPGGGRLTVSIDRVSAHPPGGAGGTEGEYNCLVVSDQGVGIAAEDLKHIFEPFFTTKHVGAGTGLGLSVAVEIVAEHGGWIEVKTEEGRGTCFRIYLPVWSAQT